MHNSHFHQRVNTTFQFVLVQLVMLKALKTLLTEFQKNLESVLTNAQQMANSHLKLAVASVLADLLLFLQLTMKFTVSLQVTISQVFLKNIWHNERTIS